MNSTVEQSWDEFLNPDVMRRHLISASVYIDAFEYVKDTIISRIRGFFWKGVDGNEEIIDPRYQSDVLSRNRSPSYASLDWLKEMVGLLRKIELRWIRNVETPSDPGFDGQEVKEDEIHPGSVLALQLLCDIALGSDEESRFYYEEFRRRLRQRHK